MKDRDHPSEKIIIALDGMDKNNVFNLFEEIPEIIWVKVGLELFVSEGPDILSTLRDRGKKIFLDLKFHDIPTTVARAPFCPHHRDLYHLQDLQDFWEIHDLQDLQDL